MLTTTMSDHPAVLKKELRTLLKRCQVASLPTLEREGLGKAVGWLHLPTVTRTVRTRTTQQDSAVDLTFVGLDEQQLRRQASRDLMHLAALTEGYLQYPWLHCPEAGPQKDWLLVSAENRERAHLPDAVIVDRSTSQFSSDAAVEFDAGYSRDKALRKLRAFSEQGFTEIVWLTSIHGRVDTLAREAAALGHTGKLRKVNRVWVAWVDFWSEADRYTDRPRCYKTTLQRVDVQSGKG